MRQAFSYTGSLQTCTIPAGATFLQIMAIGGGGGSGSSGGSGGNGTVVIATYNKLQAGSFGLTVLVGGGGNGGWLGPTPICGGGGGISQVIFNPAGAGQINELLDMPEDTMEDEDCLAQDRFMPLINVIAGGGGGGGAYNNKFNGERGSAGIGGNGGISTGSIYLSSSGGMGASEISSGNGDFNFGGGGGEYGGGGGGGGGGGEGGNSIAGGNSGNFSNSQLGHGGFGYGGGGGGVGGGGGAGYGGGGGGYGGSGGGGGYITINATTSSAFLAPFSRTSYGISGSGIYNNGQPGFVLIEYSLQPVYIQFPSHVLPKLGMASASFSENMSSVSSRPFFLDQIAAQSRHGGAIAMNTGAITNTGAMAPSGPQLANYYSFGQIAAQSRHGGAIAMNTGAITNTGAMAPSGPQIANYYSFDQIAPQSRHGGAIAMNTGAIATSGTQIANYYSLDQIAAQSRHGGAIAMNTGAITNTGAMAPSGPQIANYYSLDQIASQSRHGGAIAMNTGAMAPSGPQLANYYSFDQIASQSRHGGAIAMNTGVNTYSEPLPKTKCIFAWTDKYNFGANTDTDNNAEADIDFPQNNHNSCNKCPKPVLPKPGIAFGGNLNLPGYLATEPFILAQTVSPAATARGGAGRVQFINNQINAYGSYAGAPAGSGQPPRNKF